MLLYLRKFFKNSCVVTWLEVRYQKTKAKSCQEMVIAIQDAAFSSQFGGSIYLPWEVPDSF